GAQSAVADRDTEAIVTMDVLKTTLSSPTGWGFSHPAGPPVAHQGVAERYSQSRVRCRRACGAPLTAPCRSALAKLRRAAPTGWEKRKHGHEKCFTREASSWKTIFSFGGRLAVSVLSWQASRCREVNLSSLNKVDSDRNLRCDRFQRRPVIRRQDDDPQLS